MTLSEQLATIKGLRDGATAKHETCDTERGMDFCHKCWQRSCDKEAFFKTAVAALPDILKLVEELEELQHWMQSAYILDGGTNMKEAIKRVDALLHPPSTSSGVGEEKDKQP